MQHPVDALLSYHYFRRDTELHQITNPGTVRLIADSGAFSAHNQGAPVDNSDYLEWLHRWGDAFYWVAALDVFGDPHQTMRNFRELLDAGIRSVPTIHVGTDPKWLDTYAEVGVDFVGLGGIVGLGKRVMRWLVAVFRYARDHHPTMRFHIWGGTTQDILTNLPLWSADSTGVVVSAVRYAEAPLFNPDTNRVDRIKFDNRTPYLHRGLLTRHYGINPGDITRSHAGNRTLIVDMLTRSVQLYAAHLQRRHHVTPPTWGINPCWHVEPGPRIHIALANTPDFRRLNGTHHDLHHEETTHDQS